MTVLARHDQPHGILSRVALLVVLYSGFCEIRAFLIGAKAGEDSFSAKLGICARRRTTDTSAGSKWDRFRMQKTAEQCIVTGILGRSKVLN